MENFIFQIVRTERSLQHLMLDDLALEERRRISPNDNHLRGYAREGDFSGIELAITSAY